MNWLFSRWPYLSMWIWIAVPVLLYIGWHTLGAPHMIWSYRFHDNGAPWDPTRARYYTSCTFIGPHGDFTVPARGGKCGWVRLFKAPD